jgi:hypothetical protein
VSLQGLDPFLHLDLGPKSVLLTSNGDGILAFEPRLRTPENDILGTARGSSILISRGGGPAVSGACGDEASVRGGRTTNGTQDTVDAEARNESSSDGSLSGDSDDENVRFSRGKRKTWLKRKRKKKGGGVWRDTGQGLQRIDIRPTRSADNEIRAPGRKPGGFEGSSAKAETWGRCPIDLGLLSVLPLRSRVTSLRAAGRTEDWGGAQRFMYPASSIAPFLLYILVLVRYLTGPAFVQQANCLEAASSS